MAERSSTQKGIVQSGAWRLFASVTLLFLLGVSSGCNQLLGLDETTEAPPPKGNAYDCSCTCTVAGQPDIAVNRTVCLPDNLNPARDPALDPDFVPSASDLKTDCRNRVEANVRQLARTCILSNIICTCDALADLSFGAECNEECPDTDGDGLPGEELKSDCSNFNPETGDKTATNVPGKAPVCLLASSDPPQSVPDPLAAGIFGHTSTCEVEGNVTITHGDDSQTKDTTGVVEFTGKLCPGASCQVGMSYRLNHVDTFEFSGFGGFASAKFTDVLASGATIPAGATVDDSGMGTFASHSTQSSGAGKRSNQVCDPSGTVCGEVSSDRAAYFGTNSQPIDVLVDWKKHECAVSGGVLGSLEDAETSVDVALAGTIVNEPPTANAGVDRTIECTSAAGAPITLDGTGSTDPENNFALFVWRQGTRTGTEVGSGPTIALNQGLGAGQRYFLKVVDTFGQMSEASTLVRVVDTTPPTITQVTAAPNVLWPPNHKMVGVTVNVTASDLCGPAVCQIAAVSSNEPINGPGDGNSTPDWQITGAQTVNLRAERSGKAGDRVYTLTVKCSDAAGNSSTKTATVNVPHNQG